VSVCVCECVSVCVCEIKINLTFVVDTTAFKETYTTKSKLKEVQTLAAAVYAKNCDEFCKNKANTYSIEENGKKTSKRRCREERDGNENKSTLNNEENTSFNLNFEIFKDFQRFLFCHRFIGKSNTGLKPNFHFYKKFN
jgi:hypothetical protein